MSKLIFKYFMDSEEGKMGRFESESACDMPVNIVIDNADEVTVEPDTEVDVEIFGISSKVSIYENEDEYNPPNTSMAPVSLIPMGTFDPVEDDWDSFEQSADILFSGIVTAVDTDDEAEEDNPNYCVTIESFGIDFNLYLRYDGEIKVGNVIHGTAWLWGEIK